MRRTTVIRRATVACCAAALAIGSSAVVASAAPAPASQPNLSPALVTAISRDLKLTPAQYLRRSDRAQKLSIFQKTARKQYPNVFAGAWLDQAGQPIVALSDGPDRPAARKAAQHAGFTVRDVAKSEAALQGEKSAFDTWLKGQPAPVTSAIRGVAIDTVNNTLAVRVDRLLNGLRLPGFIDPNRVIVTAPPIAAETMPLNPVAGEMPGPAVIGGQAYASVDGSRALRCSTGFNGVDGQNNVVNITAGHCDPNIPAAGRANAPMIHAISGGRIAETLGSFQKSILGHRDYSIVRIHDGAKNRFRNNLVGVPGAPPLPITGWVDPVVGMPACKAGSRTGFSCGTVNSVNQSVQVGDRQLDNSFSMNICALPGDSGGAVVSGTRALGISSASSVADYPFCFIADIIGFLTGNAPQLFAQPIGVVLRENPGLRLRTN